MDSPPILCRVSSSSVEFLIGIVSRCCGAILIWLRQCSEEASAKILIETGANDLHAVNSGSSVHQSSICDDAIEEVNWTQQKRTEAESGRNECCRFIKNVYWKTASYCFFFLIISWNEAAWKLCWCRRPEVSIFGYACRPPTHTATD